MSKPPIFWVYISLLAISFILSFFTNKKAYPALRVLPFLLGVSLLVEGVINFLRYSYPETDSIHPNKHYYIYHFYIPLEHALLVWYFYLQFTGSILKKVTLVSIPVAVLLLLTVSVIGGLSKFPAESFNIHVILIAVFSIAALIGLDVSGKIRLLQNPYLWINFSWLLFSSITIVNLGYAYLDPKETPLFIQYLNNSLNIILYTLQIIGLICSRMLRFKG